MSLSPLARLGVGTAVLAGVGGTAAFGIGLASAAGSDPKEAPSTGEAIKTGVQLGALIGLMGGMTPGISSRGMGAMLVFGGLGAASGALLGAAGGAGYALAS